MKLIRNTHTADVLTLTKEDLDTLRNGNTLTLNGVSVTMEQPDYSIYAYIRKRTAGTAEIYVSDTADWNAQLTSEQTTRANVHLVFDGKTHELKNVEML